MSSNDIYTPYFYIIQHIKTGKMYAGSRWAKNCHPDEFMKIGGYTTSSNTINSIINEEGVDSFIILRIDTYCDGIHPHDYETLFLQSLNCANLDNWFNYHNNHTIQFGSTSFENMMIQKYGVSNISHIKSFHNKAMKTRNKNMIQKYGVPCIFQAQEFKEKFKLKKENAFIEKFGVDNPFKNEHIQQSIKTTLIDKYGADNPAKFKFFSIIETRKTYSRCHLSRYFPEFKQYY